MATPAHHHPAARKRHPIAKPSRKINAVAVGGAAATILWILLAAYVTTDLSQEALAALSGATATIFAAVLGWWVPN